MLLDELPIGWIFFDVERSVQPLDEHRVGEGFEQVGDHRGKTDEFSCAFLRYDIPFIFAGGDFKFAPDDDYILDYVMKIPAAVKSLFCGDGGEVRALQAESADFSALISLDRRELGCFFHGLMITKNRLDFEAVFQSSWD